MSQMLEVAEELIWCFDQSTFNSEMEAFLLWADVSESFLETLFEHLCLITGLILLHDIFIVCMMQLCKCL